ncbi:hypothetical protein N0V90_006128 [Kalmusia sp. IMI 367209]|nr:hypothetical protein N0V90_006128 [Kalmusia sp. IMI 367209]
MGGGHSLLQSQFGFSLDNTHITVLSANVVLANGTSVHTSSTTHPDLFWALRGAGHNFGVVTSFTMRTYPIPSTYSIYTLIYTKDKLKGLFSLVNDIDSPPGTRDPKLFLNGLLLRSAAFDNQPVFSYTIVYEGTQHDLETRAAPFLALGPASKTLLTHVSYDRLYQALGFGKETFICSKNTNQAISGVALPKWNIAGVQKMYEAVQAVDPRSTALAIEERERPILSTVVIHYEGDDEAASRDTQVYLAKFKDAIYTGLGTGKRHAYVNYASGKESVEEVYGKERWRVEKLKALKRVWDPESRFRFYNPIVVEED